MYVVDVPIVGHPMHRDRFDRGHAAAGQPEVDIVLGFKKLVGALVNVRPFVLDKENVGNRILARR